MATAGPFGFTSPLPAPALAGFATVRGAATMPALSSTMKSPDRIMASDEARIRGAADRIAAPPRMTRIIDTPSTMAPVSPAARKMRDRFRTNTAIVTAAPTGRRIGRMSRVQRASRAGSAPASSAGGSSGGVGGAAASVASVRRLAWRRGRR